MCLNIFFCLSTFAGVACAFCHPLMRILFLPLCTPPNLFTSIMQWWKPCYSKKPWMAAGSSVQGVSLHSHHAPPCLFGIVSPLIYAPVTSWNGPCQCCSTGILSALVNKTHHRPHLQEPNPQMLCCVDAVLCHSSLGSMRLPIVLPLPAGSWWLPGTYLLSRIYWSREDDVL